MVCLLALCAGRTLRALLIRVLVSNYYFFIRETRFFLPPFSNEFHLSNHLIKSNYKLQLFINYTKNGPLAQNPNGISSVAVKRPDN